MNWETGGVRKKYLLGELSEAERQEFECALLAAPEQAESLELVEQELIDDYLCGALTSAERARFDDYFLVSPARQRQLLMAQTLTQYAADTQPALTPVPQRNWLSNLWGSLFGGRGEWQPALAFTLLAAFGVALVWWFFAKPRVPADELAHRATPTPFASPSVAPTATPVVTASIIPRPSPPLPSDEVIAMDIRARAGGDPADSLIREKRAAAVGSLNSKRVYLEADGDRRLRRTISAGLTRRLQAGGKFSFTANPDEAGTALKVTVAARHGARLALTARLVDAEGKVIWPLTPRAKGRRYEGPTEKVLERLRRDLLRDVGRLEQQQK